MKKRLRYAMPHVPLHKHRQEAVALRRPEDENENTQVLLEAAPVETNVGIMARRIGEAKRKKRRAYRPPPERPLGGDVERDEDTGHDGEDDETQSLQ